MTAQSSSIRRSHGYGNRQCQRFMCRGVHFVTANHAFTGVDAVQPTDSAHTNEVQ